MTPDPRSARVVREEPSPGNVPLWPHPEWSEAFPWLVQGTTGRGIDGEPFDLGLFGSGGAGGVLSRWEALCLALAMPRAVHGRQVHGDTVRFHGEGAPGVQVVPPCDGHASRSSGVLLAVATADCVPVFLVAPAVRAVAAVHAGWRGAAAGILERGLAVLQERVAASLADVHVHLGPAICGACYEVGPEVHAALGLDEPRGPTPVDLRGALADRAVRGGVPPDHVTVSGHCTRCGDASFFSHRGGCRERQLGVIGVR